MGGGGGGGRGGDRGFILLQEKINSCSRLFSVLRRERESFLPPLVMLVGPLVDDGESSPMGEESGPRE